MANDLRFTDLVANAMMDALHTAFGNAGIFRVYADAGTPDIPAGEPAAGASHGTLLAELTLNAAAFGDAAASGAYSRITAGAITADSSANNAGTSVYWVLYDSAGTTAKAQGTIGTSGCDATIDNTLIAAGANVSCSAGYFQLPKGWTTA
jgi:hypothetical protein